MKLCSLPINSSGPGARQYDIGFFLLGLLTALAYYTALDARWFLDDRLYFLNNSSVHITSLDMDSLLGTLLVKGIRPLSNFSFAINYALFGLDNWWFHLVNVLIHFLTGVALFHLFARILRLPVFGNRFSGHELWIALGAAAMWTAHPLNINAVTYGCQRMTSQSALFCICAMIFYLKARTTSESSQRLAHYLTCGLCTMIAIGFKQNAILVPFFLLLFEVIFFRTARGISIRFLLSLSLIFFLLLGAAFLWLVPDNWTLLSYYDNRYFSLLERLLSQPRVHVFYLSLLFFPAPWRFSLEHGSELSISLFTPWTTIPAMLLLLALFLTAVYRLRSWPLFSLAVLFFFIGHSIESSVIPLEMVFDYRNYLPTIFIYLAIAAGIHALIAQRRKGNDLLKATGFVLCCLSLIFALCTREQNRLFQNPYLYYKRSLEMAPETQRSYTGMGIVLRALGHPEEAERYFQQALNLHSEARGREYIAYYNMGLFQLTSMHNLHGSFTYLTIGRVYEPHDPMILFTLSNVSVRLGLYRQTLQYTGTATGQNGMHYSLEYYAAQALLQAGLFERAAYHANNVLERQFDKVMGYVLSGEIFRVQGEFAKARIMLERCLFFDTDNLQALCSLLLVARELEDPELLSSTAARLAEVLGDRDLETALDQIPHSPVGPVLTANASEIQNALPE